MIHCNGGPAVLGLDIETSLTTTALCATCNPSPQIGTELMGSSLIQTAVLPLFSFVDHVGRLERSERSNRWILWPNFLMSYATTW
jgi:hypothetical protein